MRTINRSVAIVRPRQPFIDWCNNAAAGGFETTLAEAGEDCLALLTPDTVTLEEARDWVSEHFAEIFQEKLMGWNEDEETWPEELTQELFEEWFTLEMHSVVLDTVEDEIREVD